MKKTCRNCQFLCYQSLASIGIGEATEPWHLRRDEHTKKPRDALRSWTLEERENGRVQNAASPINMGMCFKGIWASNSESKEEQERVGFMQGFIGARMQLETGDDRVSEPMPKSEFSLDLQINRKRRNCFWNPFESGRELPVVELLESGRHSSGEHRKTRLVAWLALLVSAVSVAVALFLGSSFRSKLKHTWNLSDRPLATLVLLTIPLYRGLLA